MVERGVPSRDIPIPAPPIFAQLSSDFKAVVAQQRYDDRKANVLYNYDNAMKEYWRTVWAETPTKGERVSLELAVDGSSGNKTLEYDMAKLMAETFALFKQRQRKYGPGNIARSGELGCLVRTSDKMARLENYYINGNVADFPDDSLEDAWVDASVYPLIALLCHRGKWPGWTPTQRSLAGGPATAPLDPPPSGGC